MADTDDAQQTAGHPADTKARDQQSRMGESLSRFEKWQIVLGLVGLLVIAIQSILLMRQTELMRKQTEIMGRQTGLMDRQLGETKEASRQADEQNRHSLKISVAQSKAALDASIQASRTDQRAWVGPIAADPLNVIAGSKLPTTVRIINTGKTPALNYRGKIAYRWMNSNTRFIANYEGKRPLFESTNVFLPGQTLDYHVSADNLLSEEETNLIMSGTRIIYLFGELTYSDIFRVKHYTRFCYMYSLRHAGFVPCDTYSDAN